MQVKVNSSAVIRNDDFVRICNVEDPRDFCGFHVKPQGLYVILPRDDATLTPGARAAICWHPTGRFDEFALELPCTVDQLMNFVQAAGMYGCIDEYEFIEWSEQTSTGTAVPAVAAQPAITGRRYIEAGFATTPRLYCLGAPCESL